MRRRYVGLGAWGRGSVREQAWLLPDDPAAEAAEVMAVDRHTGWAADAGRGTTYIGDPLTTNHDRKDSVFFDAKTQGFDRRSTRAFGDFMVKRSVWTVTDSIRRFFQRKRSLVW